MIYNLTIRYNSGVIIRKSFTRLAFLLLELADYNEQHLYYGHTPSGIEELSITFDNSNIPLAKEGAIA